MKICKVKLKRSAHEREEDCIIAVSKMIENLMLAKFIRSAAQKDNGDYEYHVRVNSLFLAGAIVRKIKETE